jgi:hypothetical protein
MKIVSMALAAAFVVGAFGFGAGPTLAVSPGQIPASGILQIDDDDDDWGDRGWRRGYGHHRGWDRGHRRHGWGHRRHHRQWGHYRPQRRCHTEWVFEFGPYGARWAPIQRCYRGW